jgi:transposase InsO family protein
MTRIMPETKQQLRYRWIKPILEKRITIKDLSEICPFSQRAIKYWLARYRQKGLEGLIDRSTRPLTSPNRTPDWLRNRILELKEQKQVGGKKIYWLLKREGMSIGERTVNKILKAEGKTRRYRRRRDYVYQRSRVTTPGEVVEVDIKYGVHFGFGRWWYQYTAIDVASKWRLLKGFDNRENQKSLEFLEELIDATKHMFKIKAVKTDNDSVFTNRITGYPKSSDPLNPRLHPFDLLCNKYQITHYLIEPGKPNQNGCVERSHRTDKEHFYQGLKTPRTVEEYNYKLRLWNNWYNDLPHCSLNGLSPNEYLRVQNVFA